MSHNKENTPTTEIKVFVYDGIVEGVMKNGNSRINVEIIDVNEDYEDFEQLLRYRDETYRDPSLHYCDYTVAHFEEEMETDLPQISSLEDRIKDVETRKATAATKSEHKEPDLSR